MYKLILSIVAMGLLLIGYVIAGPHLTLNNIKEAIEQGDSEQLSENIDFPVLRTNMKDQLNATMVNGAEAELKDNPFGVMAMGFVSSIVDKMVDAFITPPGLATIMQGHRPKLGEPASLEDTGTAREPFKDARYAYDGLSKFSMWVPDDSGSETRFILSRDFLSWKLTNIVFPEVTLP